MLNILSLILVLFNIKKGYNIKLSYLLIIDFYSIYYRDLENAFQINNVDDRYFYSIFFIDKNIKSLYLYKKQSQIQI
jgi:hypothetical protein